MSTADAASRLRVVQPGEHAHPDRNGDSRQSFELIDRRRARLSRAARSLGAIAVATVVVALVGALVLHASMVEAQQGLDQRNDEIEQLEATTEVLRQQLAELAAPARVVAEAKKFGMIEAPSIVYLNAPAEELDERTLTVARRQLEGSG